VSATAEVAGADPATKTFPVLHITEWENGSVFKYKYFLILSPGKYISGESKEIKADRTEYVAQIYSEIENRFLDTDGDFESFQDELRALGGTLLDELVPANVQAALWEVRDKLSAIQVVAEEPFIPWELVHLKEPPKTGGRSSKLPKDSHFLAEKGLVRWLHNKPEAPLSLTIRKDRAYYLIPDYEHPDSRLPSAQAEIPFLESKFSAQPLEPDINVIRRLLRNPDTVDLFHFSGHGLAKTAGAVEAKIMLSDSFAEGQRFMQANDVKQHAQMDGEESRPLVTLNACQVGRAGWRLSSLGGFADAFLDAGAGVFVGSLWSVGDAPAKDFSEGFYKALLGKKSLSEAATAGRVAAQKAKEGTWLAYVVYGYPHATLKVKKS
jgi:hypothetical protein